MGYVYEALKKAENDYLEFRDTHKPISKQIQQLIQNTAESPIQHKPQIISDFYFIKERLQALFHSMRVKTFAFTSTHLGEGVTTTVAHLGFVWASSIQWHYPKSATNGVPKILLVDANLKNPDLHHYFNLENNFGLAECLSLEFRPGNFIKKTRHQSLSVMPAGNAKGEVSEYFSMLYFKDLLKELEQTYDYILIDAPAILSSPEFISLGSVVKNFVLVLEAEKTKVAATQKALSILNDLNSRAVATILNKRKYYIPDKIYRRI